MLISYSFILQRLSKGVASLMVFTSVSFDLLLFKDKSRILCFI